MWSLPEIEHLIGSAVIEILNFRQQQKIVLLYILGFYVFFILRLYEFTIILQADQLHSIALKFTFFISISHSLSVCLSFCVFVRICVSVSLAEN